MLRVIVNSLFFLLRDSCCKLTSIKNICAGSVSALPMQFFPYHDNTLIHMSTPIRITTPVRIESLLRQCICKLPERIVQAL